MMRTKQLFKTRLLSLATLCSMALAVVSCANEDIAQNNTGGDNNKNLTAFIADKPTKTRTSIDYTTGNFYWEEGDKIYVKDDDGTLQVSNAIDAAHAHSTSFSFMVPGKFNNSTTYKVYYLGKNGSGNQVTIPTAQTQTKPNDTKHLGEFGDYGTATASGIMGGRTFRFQLEHQATILVFQPYTSNDVLKKCYLTKVEVSSDNDITETYTIDPVTGNLIGSAGDKQIILTTKDPASGSANEKGFSLTNAASSSTADKVYMLIKPGTHTLKVRYWVKDITTNVEGTITKALPSFNYSKNTYYDLSAALDTRAYDGNNYYMWDAQQQYWNGFEWTKNLAAGVGQPVLDNNTSTNYAQSNSDNRWYNESFSGFAIPTNAQTTLFKSLPNANELAWYCLKGDPRWDADELWTIMGHLYKGGMWFLKKSKIPNFTNTHIPDNTSVDLRRQISSATNNSLNSGLPSASEIGDYFYLPALGSYYHGQLYGIGVHTSYWSSSAHPFVDDSAYSLLFFNNMVTVNLLGREYGYYVQAFK